MSASPQDVYARHLLSSRGYPLWIPEPSHQLLLSRPDGLRIGDVGVVVPEDGGFEVFFNICLPGDHPFHRATGVPDNFRHVEVRDEDIRTIPRVENPGRIISTSSVTKIRKVEPPSGAPGAQVSGLGYEFDLSSSGGALLILPDGAERCDLRNNLLFFEEATRHGADWYRFAEERLGRMISHDSLYLITGFYKTRSWSLAAFENVAGSGVFSAQFKMTQVDGRNIAGAYTWETTRALDWRAGPMENYGLANQSVFIRGFKVALRTGFLGKKRIEVKADTPSTSRKSGGPFHFAKRDVSLSNDAKWFQGGGYSGRGLDKQGEVDTIPIIDQVNDSLSRSIGETGKDVMIQPVPELSEIFHPSNSICWYLLTKDSLANVAVVHDDDWITLLEKAQLHPEDFVRANSFRVEAALAANFHVISREVLYSCRRKVANDNTSILVDKYGTMHGEEKQVKSQPSERVETVQRRLSTSVPEMTSVTRKPRSLHEVPERRLKRTLRTIIASVSDFFRRQRVWETTTHTGISVTLQRNHEDRERASPNKYNMFTAPLSQNRREASGTTMSTDPRFSLDW